MKWKNKTNEVEWSIRTTSRVYLEPTGISCILHPGIGNACPNTIEEGWIRHRPWPFCSSTLANFIFVSGGQLTAFLIRPSNMSRETLINTVTYKSESCWGKPSQALFDSVTQSRSLHSKHSKRYNTIPPSTLTTYFFKNISCRATDPLIYTDWAFHSIQSLAPPSLSGHYSNFLDLITLRQLRRGISIKLLN